MADLILPAPLWRRLVAALYDGLLVLAMWMVLTLFFVIAGSYVGRPVSPPIMRTVFVLAALVFFVRSWLHGGQTLGMKTWRLQLRSQNERPLTLSRGCLRYALAWISWGSAGLGMLWCLVDPQRRAWHDIATATEVVVLPKR